MNDEKMTKSELLKELARVRPYEWNAYDWHDSLDQLAAILILVRDSEKVSADWHAKNAINGAISLIFGIQCEIETLMEKGK